MLKKGFKNKLDYFWGGSIDKQSSDFYGVTFSADYFYPVTKKITVNSRLFGGSMNGTSIPYDSYIKLGGTVNNSKRREFFFPWIQSSAKIFKKSFCRKTGTSR